MKTSILEILDSIDKESIIDESVEEINQFIFEDRTIANEVKTITDIIGETLFEEIKKITSKPYKNEGVDYKQGTFKFNLFNITIDVVWEYYDIYSDEGLHLNKRDYINADIGRKRLNICLISIDKRFNKKAFYENLQHEISHFFERGKRGKPYHNLEKYNTSITKMNNALTDYEGIIASIIYINHKFEQRAFGNGAYQYMMKSNDYNNNFNNAIKDTQLFKWLTQIKNDYVFIKNTPQGHPLLKAALKPYNITYDKLLEITKETIDNLIRMLGRIKSKALDDYREQNEVHSMQEHITKEGLERKWEEIIKINEKYFS